MDFAALADKQLNWLDGSGPSAEIVVSTRVRLARNLRGHRFPHHASTRELDVIRQEASSKICDQPSFCDGWNLDLESCTGQQRQFLLERHLASPDLLNNTKNSSLLLGPAVDRVVMVNEEDHLRVQIFRAGFDPLPICRDALLLDQELEEVLDFAFSDDFGYLTACPTNVGTGFRLSVLIHLPALVLAGEIEKILNSLRQLQFAVRGLFGEGSAVRGALFQVSNLGTLGRSEEDLTNDFARHVAKVIQYETLARQKLLEKDKEGIWDMVHRSFGMLRRAYLLTSHEAFDRLSNVRMGVSLGILPAVAMDVLNRALVEMQSAHVQIKAGRVIQRRERAAARAAYFRELLS